MSIYLYLDIETVPDESRKHLWGLPEVPDPLPDPYELVTKNANAITDFLKRYAVVLDHDYLAAIYDEECAGKNRSTIKAAATKAFEAETNLIKELSLDPERCRIAAIGMAIEEHPPIAECPTAEDEWETLNHFWAVLRTQNFTLIGYNILGFDLPVICARSILLGVIPTISIDWRKYGNQQVIDLMLARFPYGKYKSLKNLAIQYGIEIPKPDVDGSLVHQMDPEEIAEYVKSDVIVTRELHRKFAGFFCDKLIPGKEEEPF